VNFNSRLLDATTIMMMKPDLVLSDTGNDFTTGMNQVTNPEKSIIKKDRKRLFGNNGTSKNKKIMLTIGLIILAMIIYILGKYLSKEPPTDTKTNIAETTVPKADEKKVVPSFIGKTQDIAENTIVNNGFLLGNITNDYSDNVTKGLIISQSPAVNTYYEKNGKIDLVISRGKKVAQVVQQIRGNKKDKDNEKDNDKDEDKDEDKKVKNNK
jgi:serine/threonine-protein kinase